MLTLNREDSKLKSPNWSQFLSTMKLPNKFIIKTCHIKANYQGLLSKRDLPAKSETTRATKTTMSKPKIGRT